ncbi:MAG: hypothetical protein JNL11_07515 [Bdellovibrionaceae bacterium]|nr:hypothetical protein [Pseudobdellovibrionaceae bacterium]
MKLKKIIKKSQKKGKKLTRAPIHINTQPSHEELLAEINITRRFLENFPAGY